MHSENITNLFQFHYHSMLSSVDFMNNENDRNKRKPKHPKRPSSQLWRYFVGLISLVFLSSLFVCHISNNYYNKSARFNSSSFGGISLSSFERSRNMNRNRKLSSSSSSSLSINTNSNDDAPTRKRKVRSLYGDNFIVAGFDNCIQNKEINEKEADILSIGLPGSGMNLLSKLFNKNCEFPSAASPQSSSSSSKIKQEWKYLSARLWQQETRKKSSSLLPVVVIQDPLQWLYTICTSTSSSSSLHPELDIVWHKAKDRCPNIIANSHDIGFYSSNTVDAQIRWNNFNATQSSKSLINLWSDYYNEWLEVLSKEEYSHQKLLIVRLEDLLFHNQKSVISNICTCSGGTIKSDDSYQSIKNPSHVKGTKLDLIDATLELAIQRYSSIKHRTKHLVHEYDINYIKDILDGKSKDLMKKFQYSNKIIDHFDMFKRSPLGLFQMNQL